MGNGKHSLEYTYGTFNEAELHVIQDADADQVFVLCVNVSTSASFGNYLLFIS